MSTRYPKPPERVALLVRETLKPLKIRKETLTMRKRNNRLCVRLSDDENNIVRNRIQSTGLSKEAYMRSVLLGNIPREKPDERFYTLMKDLSGIANNANQLARKANAFGSIHSRMLQTEAEKWSRFQTDIREAILLPEKQ